MRKLKHLKGFNESVDEMTLSDIERNDLIKTLNRTYAYDTDEETTGEEQLDYLLEMLDEIKNQDTIVLYRVIYTKTRDDIDRSNLGNHYVKSLDSFHEGMIDDLYHNVSLNIDSDIDYHEDLWLVTIEADTSDVDYKGTLIKNVEFPFEEEILLKNNANYKLIKIEKYFE